MKTKQKNCRSREATLADKLIDTSASNTMLLTTTEIMLTAFSTKALTLCMVRSSPFCLVFAMSNGNVTVQIGNLCQDVATLRSHSRDINSRDDIYIIILLLNYFPPKKKKRPPKQQNNNEKKKKRRREVKSI